MTFGRSGATRTPQQRPGFIPVVAIPRATQAVIPARDNVVRQDGWQDAAEACLGRDRAHRDRPGLGVLIVAGDLAIGAREEPVVAARDTPEGRRQSVPGV
jgi:hypothetical protein